MALDEISYHISYWNITYSYKWFYQYVRKSKHVLTNFPTNIFIVESLGIFMRYLKRLTQVLGSQHI